MSGAHLDDWELAAYPPETFLQPWTLRKLRQFAAGVEDLGPLLAALAERRRVDVALDPTISTYLAHRAADWAEDFDLSPAAAEAMLGVGYLWGRLLVGTAGQVQDWSDEPDRDEIGDWLERTVAEIDGSGCGPLVGLSTAGVAGIVEVLADELATHRVAGDELVLRGAGALTLSGPAGVMCEEGWCLALVEHSATRPTAWHLMVDLTAIADLLPASVFERVGIAEALGCLLGRLDHRGRCSEAELRDAADELGGERGHRYFRQFRRWGLVDYTLTRSHRSTVAVPRHRELRSGPPT